MYIIGKTTMFSEKYVPEIKNFEKNMVMNTCSENDKIELLDEIAKYFIIESSLVKVNCLFCDKCKKWYNKNISISKTKIKMVKNVLTHVDAGYGDDDIYGDVTYLIYYHECPLCHEEIEDRKTTIKVENEH